MAYDRSDWQARLEDRETSRLRKQRIDLEFLQQAEVKAELLTGLPEWDVFLQYLQAAINESCKQRDAFLGQMAMPGMSTEKVMEARDSVLALNAQVNAWLAVMQLPRDIQERGKSAEALLARLRALDGA